MSTGLAVALNVLPAESFDFQVMLAAFEIGFKAEVTLDFFLDAGDVLGLGQLEDRLSVVGHRAVAIDGDVDRAHAEESERHQTKCKDGTDAYKRLSFDQLDHHQTIQALKAHEEGDGHQARYQDAIPKCAEVARHDTGKDG